MAVVVAPVVPAQPARSRGGGGGSGLGTTGGRFLPGEFTRDRNYSPYPNYYEEHWLGNLLVIGLKQAVNATDTLDVTKRLMEMQLVKSFEVEAFRNTTSFASDFEIELYREGMFITSAMRVESYLGAQGLSLEQLMVKPLYKDMLMQGYLDITSLAADFQELIIKPTSREIDIINGD